MVQNAITLALNRKKLKHNWTLVAWGGTCEVRMEISKDLHACNQKLSYSSAKREAFCNSK